MSAVLLTPGHPTQLHAGQVIDPAGLRPALNRVAGAVFCTNLDPVVIAFVRARIADHFAVPDDEVDAGIATQLLRLATRLSGELEYIASL
jgi:hypothetical protein